MLPKIFPRIPLAGAKYVQKRCFSKKNFYPSDVQKKLGVLGVPFGKGQKNKGKDEVGLKIAPDIIRRTGFIDDLEEIGLDIQDYGDVTYEPDGNLSMHNMHNLCHFAPCAKAVSDAVECILKDERSCLVLGGDHSIAVGSVHAHLKIADPRKVALLFVDAHGDVNTYETSPSGNIHGMVVALLAQELRSIWEDSELQGMDWMTSFLTFKNFAYIGTRSVDHPEAKFLKEHNIATFGIEDIDKLGIQKVLRNALEKIDPANNKSLHVSFDIDSVDPLEAPCTGCPVRGGLTLREAICLLECLRKTQRVSVVDLVEVNMAIGTENQRELTLEAVYHILLAAYGHSRKGNLIKAKESTNNENKLCE